MGKEDKKFTPEEISELKDRIIACVKAAQAADEAYDKAVKELCDIAEELNYRPLWAYFQLVSDRHTVDERAVRSIAKATNHKPYWAKKEIERLKEMLKEPTPKAKPK